MEIEMSNSCIIIRTNILDSSLDDIKLQAKEYFDSPDIYIFIENFQDEALVIERLESNIYIVGRGFLEEKGLLYFLRAGWQCGDYLLYAAYEILKDNYDYYWMIEPDVRFTIEPKKFFSSFENNQDDLIGVFYGDRGFRWNWYKASSSLYPNHVKGMIFALVRLSSEALSFSLEKRTESFKGVFLDEVFLEKPRVPIHVPNDEGFIATTLYNNNYKCSSFNKYFPELFENSFSNRPIHPIELSNDYFKNKVVHPVLENWDIILRKLKINFLQYNMDSNLQRVLRLEECNKDIEVHNSLGVLKALANMSVYDVKALKTPPKSLAVASISNFDTNIAYKANKDRKTLDFLTSKNFLKKFKPFSFEGGNIFFIETPAELFEAPFLYLAQRNYAERVVEVELSSLDLSNELIQDDITFVFSIGRCGSTLVSKIFSKLDYLNVSECDVFTQTDNKKAIDFTLKAFQFYNYEDNTKILIKNRSQTNKFVDMYIENYPNAKYIFLYRDKESWAKSFNAKFGFGKNELNYLYKLGYNALRKLLIGNVDLEVWNYHDLVNNPSIYFKDESRLNVIKEVLSTDSQRGVIDNSNIIKHDEKVIDDFILNIGMDIEDLI